MFIRRDVCVLQVDDPCVVDVIDKACPAVVEAILPHLPAQEKVRG